MIIKEMKNNDGSTDTIIINSQDNQNINIDRKFKIANNYSKPNKLGILTSDIGIKNNLYTKLFITSLAIVIISIVIMFYNYRIY